MTELYRHYHGCILRLARASTADGAWRAKLREILAEFDEDCSRLPALGRYVLRNELATQIEPPTAAIASGERMPKLAPAETPSSAPDAPSSVTELPLSVTEAPAPAAPP